MKKQLLFILIILFSVDLCGQEVSIELSIEWKKKQLEIYNDLDFDHIPFLKIRYNNLTDDSIYLPRIYEDSLNLPDFSSGPLFNGGRKGPFNLAEIKEIQQFAEGEVKCHIVSIGGRFLPATTSWLVYADSINPHEEIPVGVINRLLLDAYKAIFQHSKHFIIKEEDRITTITEVQILGELKEHFVFLNPHSQHVEYYNLIGFKVVGGSYLFKFAFDEISDFVLSEPPSWSDKQEMWIYEEVELPTKAGNYHLYSGAFYTNEVVVTF